MLLKVLGILFILWVILSVYWKVTSKKRPYILLFASLLFYAMISVRFIWILIVLSVIAYFGAGIIEQKSKSRAVLFVGIILVSSFLLYYKYSPLLGRIFSALHIGLFAESGWMQKVLVPIGISYFTFEAIGYMGDIYKGKYHAEQNYLKVLLFLSFFPTVMSGPIKRYDAFSEAISKDIILDESKVYTCLEKMLWGAFKKTVIADRIGALIAPVMDCVHAYDGFAIFLAAAGYTIELYCDFSGYSDMAIGIAGLFGIEIPNNFNHPYFSGSIKEFWDKWHISLSSWLADYIYIPLGGNRKGKLRTYINLMATFLISGIWHGAGVKFVFWGMLHGSVRCIEKIFGLDKGHRIEELFSIKAKEGIKIILRILLLDVFLIFSWLPFALPTFSDFVYAATHLMQGIQHPISYIQSGLGAFYATPYSNLSLGVGMLTLTGVELLQIFRERVRVSNRQRIFAMTVIVVEVMIFNSTGNPSFIYFNF